MSEVGWVACSYCAAISLGAPPHGQGQPCPMKMDTEERYRTLLSVQTASYQSSGFAMNDMTATLRKMAGEEEKE